MPRESAKQVQNERVTYQLFRLSILGKGLVSALEIIGGLLVFFIPPSAILAIADFLTHDELTEVHHDFLALYIQHAAQNLVSSTTFVAFYLLSRGLVKLALIIALLLNKIWAYPWSIAVLGLFILYQAYQMIVDFSSLILLLTIFDLIVIYFIWKEYEIVKARRGVPVK